MKKKPALKKTLPHILAITVIGAVTSELLKLIFRVPRPCFNALGCPLDFSFPSTHTTIAFTFFTLMAMVYQPAWYLGALPFGLQRIIAGVHTWTDVGAGAFLGTLIGVVAHKLHLERRVL